MTGPILRTGRWLVAGAMAAAAGVACAADDPLVWLQKIADAARSTTYAGTFVHTNGNRTSTVKVSHRVISGEEHERIEPLDGPPIEIVRKNEELYCYVPEAKTLRLDRRVTARFFPSIFRAQADIIARSYDVKLGGTERIVGHDCQWVHLDPRDALRFAQRLCAEVASGLLIRARTLNDKQQMIEQFTFTDLKIGPAAQRSDVRSLFKSQTKEWQTDATPLDESRSVDTGWQVANPPSGFTQVQQMRRTLPGRTQPVSQIVLSDGVASMSVFIEAVPSTGGESIKEEGATTFYTRPGGDFTVTVLGEVPSSAARQAGRSLLRRP